MKRGPEGLIPAREFLEAALSPRPSFNDGSEAVELPVLTGDDHAETPHRSLRTPLSTYGKRVRYVVHEFDQLLDSSSINASGWAQIARTIFRNYRNFDAFVVLHGTDSLAYTCSALSFMLQNLGKTVIFTGSQAPMLELQNDATDNLLGSLIIAGHFIIPEVGLYFNHKLIRGNRATKVSASDFEAFASPNFPPLATISSLKTHVSWELIYRPTHIKAFSIQTSRATGEVACLRIFPGIKPEMVDAVLKLEGLKGLILETFGSGNAPSGIDGALTKALADGVRRGTIIVNITQCLKGAVTPLYEAAAHLKQAGVIPGQDMTTECALAKLSYLLASPGLRREEIVEKMSESLRGEITTPTSTAFAHPHDIVPAHLANLTRLGKLANSSKSFQRATEWLTTFTGYSISQGDDREIERFLQNDLAWLLNEADYSGNTPLHIAATGPNPAIVKQLLEAGMCRLLVNGFGGSQY